MWTATVGDYRISASTDQLRAFAAALPAVSLLSTRVSDLFWFDLYVLQSVGWVDPCDVLEAIHSLETNSGVSGVKPATPFCNPPLNGLWHQHYFSPRFAASNMRLGLGKGGLERVINEVVNPELSAIVTPGMINELAHRVTIEPIEKRAGEGRLTGEWIVFARSAGQNYYLCLAAHETGDQRIFDRIMQHCVRDFPQLRTWLQAA